MTTAGIPQNLVVLTGAGISAENGVPILRDEAGLWRNFRPEELATPAASRRDPVLVWEWYEWRRGLTGNCQLLACNFSVQGAYCWLDRDSVIDRRIDNGSSKPASEF